LGTILGAILGAIHSQVAKVGMSHTGGMSQYPNYDYTIRKYTFPASNVDILFFHDFADIQKIYTKYRLEHNYSYNNK